jgi:hypothetical protein
MGFGPVKKIPSQDVREENDLSGKHPEIVQRMKSRFKNWQDEMANAEPRMPFKDY